MSQVIDYVDLDLESLKQEKKKLEDKLSVHNNASVQLKMDLREIEGLIYKIKSLTCDDECNNCSNKCNEVKK